jgi:hypothetical protein
MLRSMPGSFAVKRIHFFRLLMTLRLEDTLMTREGDGYSRLSPLEWGEGVTVRANLQGRQGRRSEIKTADQICHLSLETTRKQPSVP